MTRASDTARLLGAGGTLNGALSVDTISEKTSGNGVTIDSLNVKDGGIGGQQIGRKNIIINGANQVAQRNDNVTGLGAASGYFTLDRFYIVENDASAGRFTMSQSAVTDLEGFSNALKIDCTTADTSIAAGEALIVQQNIEGFNLQQLKATSTTTRAMTLSFYAKSNASRAIATELRMSNGTNRQASKLHTIGTSWARYTFTVPAASSMQIDNDNSNEMQINFWLHGGSTFTGGTLSATFESSNNANRAAGIGSIFASTDNEIEITGIQLEVGSQATPFEHRSFGEELALCERYFQRYGANSTYIPVATGISNSQTTARIFLVYKTQMRATPTIVSTTSLVITDRTVYDLDVSSIAISGSSDLGMTMTVTHTANSTYLRPAFLSGKVNGSPQFHIDAEL